MNSARTPELEFLPAALEVEETPPLPAARLLLWTIVLSACAASAWCVYARVDIVGVAPGILVTTGRTKLVQAHTLNVVERVHVREGQRVAAGDLLVEFDPGPARAEHARLAAECTSLALDAARLAQLVAATRAPRTRAVFVPPAGEPSPRAATMRAAQQFELQLKEFSAALAGIADERRQNRSARDAQRARIDELARTLPLIAESAEAHRALTMKGIVPRIRWLETERERIAAEQELTARREDARALDAAFRALGERRDTLAAQYRARWAAEREDVLRRLAGCREAMINNERTLRLSRLRAPVAGTIQELAVHTEGGVVDAAQPLMRIAPSDAALEVEARVLQRDIGFVRLGQPAVVKLDAFDYTRYGVLHGRVVRLSRDAVQAADEEPYFLAQVALDDTRLRRDGREHAVEPGMRATVEMAMGRRRVVEFLLSPLLRYRSESARER